MAHADADAVFFAFEADFVAALRCIPMSVRLKLDRCGIKLSLRQWSRFTQDDRRALVHWPCTEPADVALYRRKLSQRVLERTGEAAQPLAETVDPVWETTVETPAIVVAFALANNLPAPTASQWARLTELQRFALAKLSRSNHDNINFAPALEEFGLIPP